MALEELLWELEAAAQEHRHQAVTQREVAWLLEEADRQIDSLLSRDTPAYRYFDQSRRNKPQRASEASLGGVITDDLADIEWLIKTLREVIQEAEVTVLREFEHKGYRVTLGEKSLAPIIGVGGGLYPVTIDVAFVTKIGEPRRDAADWIARDYDLDIWQKNAKNYLDTQDRISH